MKGIYNSDANPLNLLNDDDRDDDNVLIIMQAINDPRYLAGQIVRVAYEKFKYDPSDPRFGDLSPNAFAAVMNAHLHTLEADVLAAMKKFVQNVGVSLKIEPKDPT